jgi:hypothetical protein
LYGCETWYLPLREEHKFRVRVFGKRVQKRIFELKRDEITGGWRELHNEELCKSYCLPNKYNENDLVKEYEMGRARSTYGSDTRTKFW